MHYPKLLVLELIVNSKKSNVVLREPDQETGDLGQFQLPDLGSKVITPNRSTGDYLNTLVGDTDETRVGPSVEVFVTKELN